MRFRFKLSSPTEGGLRVEVRGNHRLVEQMIKKVAVAVNEVTAGVDAKISQQNLEVRS